MNVKTNYIAFFVIATVIFLGNYSRPMAQTYSGQAIAVSSTVNTPLSPVLTTSVADTGPLPSAGGSITLASTSVSIPGILSVGNSTVSSSGGGNNSQSTASIVSLNIGVLTNTISATAVSSSAQGVCPAGTASGSSIVTGLVLNGSPVTVTGAPNQTITLLLAGNPIGTLTINEQIVSPGGITVNALHLFVTDPNDSTTINVIVASSHADIQCPIAPAINRYSGRGTGVRLRQQAPAGTDISSLISDTGFLPRSGSATISTTTTGAGVSPLLSTGVVSSSTSGGLPAGNANRTESSSAVNNLAIDALGTVVLNANTLTSNTECTCSVGIPSCSGTSQITGLAVSVFGIPFGITITGAPNQVVTLPLGTGTLIINEQASAGAGDITVNALNVTLNVAGLAQTNVIISSAHSDITCGLLPSAADVSVFGRVMNASGNPVPKATVTLSGPDGTRTSITNSFGYYGFTNVPAGVTYFMTASRKGYSFPSRVLSVTDDLSDVDFISETVRELRAIRPERARPGDYRSDRANLSGSIFGPAAARPYTRRQY